MLILIYTLVISKDATANNKDHWHDAIGITGGITTIVQGTSGNENLTAGTRDDTDHAYTLDINLGIEPAPRHMVFVHIETGEGEGVNDNFESFISPNYDPYNTINTDTKHQDLTLSQAFYEGILFDAKLTVDIGKMDIHSLSDENDFAGDETTQFLASIFARLDGWGISLDQFISKHIGIFFRYGSQSNSLTENRVNRALSGGVSVMGNIWKRSDDFVGAGYGVVDQNDKLPSPFSGSQKVFELFYHLQLLEKLAITPSIQIHSKLPRTSNRDVNVYGVRVQLDFF